MKFTHPLAVAAVLVSISAASAQEMKLKIGTEGAYPPFNNLTADGKLEGFDVDIARAVCAEMKATCEFVTQDWDGIIPALKSGKFDAIVASMSITDERKQEVDFSAPYYTNSLSFVAPKNSKFDPQSLDGKPIGAQQGTVAANYIEDKFPKADLKAYPSQLEAWADLSNGRVDAVLGDFGVQYGWVNSAEGACCEFKGEPLAGDDKIGIAVRKSDTELRDKLSAAITAIRANGKYAEINKKYFPFDIYGQK